MTEPMLRVLLIEDDEDDYLITRDLLHDVSPSGLELIWRDNMHDGLETLEQERIDVSLVDLRLGPDSGLDVIREAQERGITSPFILLTGQGDADLDARAVELGASDYLVKGRLDGHTLIRSIRYAVDRAAANEDLASSEAHYRLLFENNPAPMYLVQPESGRIESMNRAALALYGFNTDERPNLTIADLQRNIRSVPREGVIIREGSRLEEHETRDGRTLYVELLPERILLDRHPLDLVMVTDMTRHINNNRRLRLLQQCIESSSNGIVIADAQKPDLPLVYVNPTFERITGFSPEESVGRNCRFLQGSGEDPSNEQALAEIRKALAIGGETSVVLRNFRKDGTPFWNDLYLSPIRNDEGDVTHFVGVQNDISDRRDVENQLAYNASHDVLTQLPNRALLEDRLEQACRFAQRHGRTLALLFIDLDGFKLINDSLGHRTGDKLLIEVARRLKEVCRTGDTVARVSGDEYVMLLPDLARNDDALMIVEQIMRTLSAPYNVNGENLHLTASIGIATTDGSISQSTELIQQADLAMYRAKQMGRNTYQWFSEQLNTEASYRVKLRNELQDAIDNERLTLYYQPLVDSRTGKARAVEALVRWDHPERGLVSPGDFLPLAEETGQIIALGQWVLEQACRDMLRLHKAGFKDCTVAVNVSPMQVRKAGFIGAVSDALEASGLPPEALELEIVESAVLYDADQVIRTLHDLRDLGVGIAIDDFGTGFSSLSYIKLLPAGKIKIDRSFIRDVIQDRSDAAITQGVISMAHHLSLDVVAEGVETDAQAAFLRRNQCDLLQGFLFARPMPLNLLEDYMHTRGGYATNAAEDGDSPEKTLLLLDDETNILRALTRVLRRDGYRILTTTSVQEAFSLLAENRVEVIISDQRMPEMSGTEFLSRVKAIYPDTVRIVLSGYTDLKSVTEAINEGSIYKFLTKPWDDKEIREHVQKAFQYHRTLQG
ncbi:MAG: EAL domain-containing protein [Marinobacter sp.]|nr:EAL domain-containing protein [Marinobacter sp.]